MSATTVARLAGLLLIPTSLGACSGDSGESSTGADPAPASSSSATPTLDVEPTDAAGESGATVTLDGTTYEFADDGGAASFCRTLGPTLQAGLVSSDGDEFQAFLVQSDADLGDLADDNEPYVDLTIGGTPYISGASSLASVVPTPPAPVDISVSGKTASGTVEFTVVGSGEVVVGDVELTCA